LNYYFEMKLKSLTPHYFALLIACISVNHSYSKDILLHLPLDCELGTSCFIQNYVDHDSSKNYRDFMCGSRTYDGHDGTDFRAISTTQMQEGIAILATADGVVLRIRDGIDDTSLPLDKNTVAGKECGNGVLISHVGGWQSQYCHLRKNSIRVKVGETVRARQQFALMGMSGLTEFPHLHLTLRHNGRVVDPFNPDNACKSSRSLWDNSISHPNDYQERIFLGFQISDHALSMQDIEKGIQSEFIFDERKEALVVHVRMIGLLKGDQPELILLDPKGSVIAQHRQQKLVNSQAQTLIYSGVKRPKGGWMNGLYTIKFLIKNNDELAVEKMKNIQLLSKH
jgi:hypothetical protein